jgi:hypothetical protein
LLDWDQNTLDMRVSLSGPDRPPSRRRKGDLAYLSGCARGGSRGLVPRKTAAAAAQRATAASGLGVLALAEQVGHHEATQTAPPQHTATDQHAHELALMAATFLFTAAFLVLVFLGAASFLHTVAEQVGHHEATQPAPPQYASADQQAHELAFLAAAALFTALLVFILFPAAASRLHAALEQVGQHEPTQAAAAYSPPDQHANKSALLVTPFAAFAVDVGAFEDIVYGRCVIWHGNLAPRS